MPLFLFLALGLLQLGLIHQGRLLARYAAYKATRAGALHRAKKDVMTDAALGVLVPITSSPQTQHIHKAASVGDYLSAWQAVKSNTQDGIPIVETTICNPLSSQLGPNNDFDDPRVASGPAGDWRAFLRTRLHVQVTFYYRLVIPFANGILFYATAGVEPQHQETFSTLRLRSQASNDAVKDRWSGAKRSRALNARLLGLAQQGKYFLPIRANYAMRLHSNVAPGELPGTNECFVNFKKADGSGDVRDIELHTKSGTSQ